LRGRDWVSWTSYVVLAYAALCTQMIKVQNYGAKIWLLLDFADSETRSIDFGTCLGAAAELGAGAIGDSTAIV